MDWTLTFGPVPTKDDTLHFTWHRCHCSVGRSAAWQRWASCRPTRAHDEGTCRTVDWRTRDWWRLQMANGSRSPQPLHPGNCPTLVGPCSEQKDLWTLHQRLRPTHTTQGKARQQQANGTSGEGGQFHNCTAIHCICKYIVVVYLGSTASSLSRCSFLRGIFLGRILHFKWQDL